MSLDEIAVCLFQRGCDAWHAAHTAPFSLPEIVYAHVEKEAERYDAELAALGYKIWWLIPGEPPDSDRPSAEVVASEQRGEIVYHLYRCPK